MSPIPTRSLDRLSVVMIVVAVLTLAGGYLLLSAAESLTLVDGAVEWQAESPLRAVVQLLCLNYQVPTIHAGDIKGYVLGMGVAVALAAIGIAALARSNGVTGSPMPGLPSIDCPSVSRISIPSHRIAPVFVAQILAALYVFWSFSSSRWSGAPQLAIAGSLLLAVQVMWSIALGHAIYWSGIRYLIRAFLVILLVTSFVALWYYYGRNPTLRAKFPFGNPTFLSACLIPGLILALVWIGHALTSKQPKTGIHYLWALVALAALVLGIWTFRLTDSRGAQVGYGAGLFAAAFFACRGRWKLAPILVAILLSVVAMVYYANSAQRSLSGRGESMRLRGYSWNYALRMFRERPISGHGQGAYTRLADAFVPEDILSDPPVFDGPIAHAHNEWLEVLAELGAVGLVLVAGIFAFTMWAVYRALANADPEHRWCLIGLGSSVIGLAVEECAGVGLRVSEVPIAFYTVLGLCWAASHTETFQLGQWASAKSWRRVTIGTIGLVSAIGVFSVTQIDFQFARVSFDIQQQLAQGRLDDALRLSEAKMWRLSPQRALFDESQRADAHLRWAERVIHRATERDQKARSIEPIDTRIIDLAHQDIFFAEEATKTGGHILKELLQVSPGYINSGLLEYRISLVRAQAALLRGDQEGSDASRKNAVAALERELQRQPFRPDLAEAYARFALPEAPFERVLVVLARPLRFGPIGEDTLFRLQQLSQSANFASALSSLTHPNGPSSDWVPELLRIEGAMLFLSGNYSEARNQLESAATLYASRPRSASLGEAATHLELAEALFYADPENPQAAIASANHAIQLAPHSRLGREFQTDVRQRLVQYHLAAGDEPTAAQLLRQTASVRVADEVVLRELGTRLRRLSESLLLQRREALILRKPADTLLPKLERWVLRAIELNPDDFAARFLAADLANHAGDDQASAAQLRLALDRGLDPADAARFLQMALERSPQSTAFATLLKEIQEAGNLATDKQEP